MVARIESLADAVDAFGADVAGHYLAMESAAEAFAVELETRADCIGLATREGEFLCRQAGAIRKAGAQARYEAYAAFSAATVALRSRTGR